MKEKQCLLNFGQSFCTKMKTKQSVLWTFYRFCLPKHKWTNPKQFQAGQHPQKSRNLWLNPNGFTTPDNNPKQIILTQMSSLTSFQNTYNNNLGIHISSSQSSIYIQTRLTTNQLKNKSKFQTFPEPRDYGSGNHITDQNPHAWTLYMQHCRRRSDGFCVSEPKGESLRFG